MTEKTVRKRTDKEKKDEIDSKKDESEPAKTTKSQKPESLLVILIKCLIIIGFVTYIALQPDEKADKRKRVSVEEAEMIYAKRIPEVVPIETDFAAMITLPCPPSYFDKFYSWIEEIGGNSTRACLGDVTKAVCGRFVRDAIMERGYFDIFQYAAGKYIKHLLKSKIILNYV